jgi:hypothetical protein
LIGLYRGQLGALNLNKLVLISQNLPSDPHFNLEENANESLYDFGDCEAIGLSGENIEDYLEDFVDSNNGAKFRLNMCIIYVWQLQLIWYCILLFHCVVFLDFFCAMWSSDELTICYRWSLGFLACQKVIQPIHP